MSITLDNIDRTLEDRVKRAVKRHEDRIRTLYEPFLQLLTRRRAIKVKAHPMRSYTDNKTVFLHVPLELGDDTDHEQENCGERDPASKIMYCPACAILDECDAIVFHESGHIVHESFEPISNQAQIDAYERLLKDRIVMLGLSPERQVKVLAKIQKAVTRSADAMVMASAVDVWLPTLVNIVEDIYVDQCTIAARAGTEASLHALSYKYLSVGSTNLNGKVIRWQDAEVNARAMMTVYLMGKGLHILIPAMGDDVLVVAQDQTIKNLIEMIPANSTVEMRFRTAMDVLAALRVHGFCPDSGSVLVAPKPKDMPPMPSQSQDDDDADDEPEDDEGEAGDGDEEAGEQGEGQAGQSDEDSDEEQDGQSGSSTSPDESDQEQDPNPRQSTPSQFNLDDDAVDEDDDGEGDGSGSKDEQGDDESPEASDDQGQAGTGGSQADDDADEESEPSDDSDADAEGDSDDDGDADSTSGSDSADKDSDDPDDDGDTDDFEDGEADDDGDGESDQVGEDFNHRDAIEDPGETKFSNETDDSYETKTDEIAAAAAADVLMNKFMNHDPDADTEPKDHTEREAQELADLWLTQRDWFDQVSPTVRNVNVAKPTASDLANIDLYGSPKQRDINPSLNLTRVAFTENRKVGIERNLKRGKRLDGAHLSRLVTDDPRIFASRNVPSKRDWFVSIACDMSGSTSGGIDKTIAKGAFAMAELLSGLGIRFAINGHTGSGYREDSAWGSPIMFRLNLMEVKSPEQKWDQAAKLRCMALTGRGSNLDGHTMEWHRRLVMSQRATDRLIMYFTDGDMPCANYDEEVEVLKRNIALGQRQGVKIVGIGVGNTDPMQYGLDTIRYDELADLPDLIRGLADRLK